MANPNSRIGVTFSANAKPLRAGTNEASAAMNRLVQSSQRMEASLKNISFSTAAVAFTQIASVASRVGVAFKGFAENSATTIDKLAKFSQRIGVTYADMAKFEIAAGNAGVNVDAVGQAMQKAEKKFAEAAGGSKTAIEAFKQLGLSVDDLSKMSVSQRFDAIGESLQDMKNPAMQSAAAMKLFEEAGLQLIPMFSNYRENLSAAADQAERLRLNFTNAEAAGVEAMNDSFAAMGRSIRSLVDNVVVGLAPGLKFAADIATDLIQKLNPEGDIGKKVAAFVFDAAELLGRAFDRAYAWISPFAEVVSSLWGAFTIGGESVDPWLVAGHMWEATMMLAEGVANGFKAAFLLAASGFTTIGAMLTGLAAKFASYIPGFKDQAEALRKNALALESRANKLSAEGYAAMQEAAKGVAAAFDPEEIGKRAGSAAEGGAEAWIEQFRKRFEDQQAAIAAAGVEGGQAVGESISVALNEGANKIAGVFDVGTSSGYAEMVRLMYGSQSQTDKQQLAETKKQTNVLLAISSKVGRGPEIAAASLG